jgi:hypothetical protein
VPEVWVSSSPWVLFEWSVYWPTAVQLPADAHDTDSTATNAYDAALAGRGACTPVAQVPEVSVSSSPRGSPERSVYWPTAVQLPAEEHDAEDNTTSGLGPALAGRCASIPVTATPAAAAAIIPAASTPAPAAAATLTTVQRSRPRITTSTVDQTNTA